MGKQPKLEAQLLTGKNCAQSEPDIIFGIAGCGVKWGIAANGLTLPSSLPA